MNNSDDELIAQIRRNPQIVVETQRAATAEHTKARMLPFAPVHGIEARWQEAKRNTLHNSSANEFSPEWMKSHVHNLRVALSVLQDMKDFSSLTQDQRSAGYLADKQVGETKHYNRIQAVASAMAPPPPTVADVLVRLRAKGLSFSREGKSLAVTPANSLTAEDREIIRINRDALLALIAAEAVIF